KVSRLYLSSTILYTKGISFNSKEPGLYHWEGSSWTGDELLTDSIADCGYPTVCGNYNEKFCFLIDGNERDMNCCVCCEFLR
ncbi:hypothetical protein H5410_038545, partial [Solanum commersonii]